MTGYRMRRRTFVQRVAGAAAGCALMPLSACSARSANRAIVPHHSDAAVTALGRHLQQQLPIWMKQSAVAGASIALVADARLAWRGAFGLADRASTRPVTHETMFEAASMSKPAFAYVVMRLR